MLFKNKKIVCMAFTLFLIYTGGIILASADVPVDHYFKEGREFLHNGDYKKAIQRFQLVIDKDRDYLKAYASMGMAYLKSGNKKMAAQYFKYLEGGKKPGEKSWNTHFQQGEYYYRNSMFKKAIEEYKLALRDNKNSYLTYFSMGSAYRKTGDMKKAYESWKSALTSNPKDKLIKRLLEKLRKELDMANKIEELQQEIGKDPSDVSKRLFLAKLYLDKQKPAKAIIQFDAVLKIDPKNRDAYLGLAALKSAMGKFNDAIRILEGSPIFDKNDDVILTQLNTIKEYKDILDGNRFIQKKFDRDLNKEMAFIPEGIFFMGSNDKSIETGVDERPEHEVYVDDFFIDRYEVTNIQYKTFVKASDHEYPYHWKDPSNNSHSEMIRFDMEYYPEEAAYFPVSYVTWYDAEAFCRWAGKRLPTEAEWEKAARGSDRRRYPWGDKFNKNKANTALSHFKGPTPIGSFPEGISPYGVHDIAGNMWEWTADWYKGYKNTSLKRDAFGEKFRVVRGGSFLDPPELHIRTSERHAELPTMKHRSIGFRCAKEKPRV